MINVLIFTLLFVAIAVVFDFFCSSDIKKNNGEFLKISPKTILGISLIILVPVLLVTFRSTHTGVDTHAYLKFFEDRIYGGDYILYRLHQGHELLFYGISYFFWQNGCTRGAFFVFAFVSLFFSFLAIYRVSKVYNPFVMSLIFLIIFYHECFNAMRQMNAVAIVFFAYTFVLSRNFVKFFLCVVVASLFHSTALCALPLYFLYPLNTQYSLPLVKRVLIAFCFFLVAKPIFFDLLSTDVFARYEKTYEGYGTDIGMVNAFKYFIVSCAPIIFLLFLFARNYTVHNETQKKEYIFLWSTVIVFSTIIFLRYLQNWLFRLGFYYQLGEFFLVGKICSKPVLERRNLLNDFKFTIPDAIVLYYFIWSLYWNFMHIEAAALPNFTLMWE